MGAISLAIVGSVAADVTGLIAASVLAGVGLWLLPRKRSQAKREFRTRTAELRTRLLSAIGDEFEREVQHSVQQVKDALAPYDHFVRSESDRADRLLADLAAATTSLQALRGRVEAMPTGQVEHRLP